MNEIKRKRGRDVRALWRLHRIPLISRPKCDGADKTKLRKENPKTIGSFSWKYLKRKL